MSPIDLLKHENLTPSITDLLTGKVQLRVGWRVQSGGRFTRLLSKIDLDALMLVANADLDWVAACHKHDPNPFDGDIHYGGDTSARGGEGTFEWISADLGKLTRNPNVKYAVFGATCFNNAAGLGKLAEFNFSIHNAEGQVITGPRMRSIVSSAATARFGVLLVFEGNGVRVIEIDDMFNVAGSLMDWRPLAAQATQIVQRNR